MKIIRRIILLFLLIIVLFLSVYSYEMSNEKAEKFIENELITKVENIDEARKISSKYDITLKSLSNHGIATYIVEEENANYIINNNDDNLVRNTLYSNQGFLRSDTYINNQYSLNMMDIKEAWNYTTGSSDVIVAIIDTGVDTDHRDLSNKISPLSYNSNSNQVGIEYVEDDQGHGTGVAGLIAATRNNGFGIAGIAENVTLLVIKANLPTEGKFSDAAVIDGIYYAVDNGADVINLSLGSYYLNPLMREAVKYADAHGVIVVAASGNDGFTSPTYPAAYEEVISVSAVNSDGLLASYSNYGSTIDIAAPGTEIYTSGVNDGVIKASGTSFASPQIAGIIALLKSYYPTDTSEQIKQKLFSTALDVGATGKDNQYGYGIANASDAINVDFVNVTFLNYLGEIISVEEITVGESINPPVVPQTIETVDSIYTFVGWDKPLNNITEDIIVRAIYERVIKKFTYTFYDWDGSIIKQDTIEYGSTIIPPLNPSRQNTNEYTYNFIEWAPTFTNGDIITQDIDFYANYEKTKNTFVVNFMMDNQVITEEVEYGSNVIFPDAPTKEGYHFVGWSDDGQNITNDTVIIPIYEKNVYQVSFIVDSNIIDIIEVNHGGNIDNIPLVPEKTGYTGKWERDSFNNITSNLIINAVYNINKFAVVFMDYNGDIIDAKTIEYNNTVSPINIMTRDGYTFDGWYLDEQLFDFDTPIVNDLTLRAKYSKIEEQPVIDPEVTNTDEVDPEQNATEPETSTEPVDEKNNNSGCAFSIDFDTLFGFVLIFFIIIKRRFSK